MILGIGVGSVPEQASIYGTDYPRRWTQAKEMVAAMQALWTQEESEYHGYYYDFPSVFCFPKPIQKPHPPILLGGIYPRVLPRVIEWADGWIPIDVTPEEVAEARRTFNAMADEAGRDPASINITVVGIEWTNPKTDMLDILTRFEQSGANRVVVSVDHAGEMKSLAQLESIAKGLKALNNEWIQ
jgi:alkanesulfonate monooxygenase SsuD/methylene tetrahydromethanopterin reductase-like flavin-dependent oxidoreductase (luciferase family)